MVNKETLLELVPHYIGMLVLLFVAVALVRVALGEIRFILELVVAVVVVALYRPLVLYLGVGPSSWER